MTRDNVFQSVTSADTDFDFNAEVAAVFDDMVVRSVPFYEEQQSMMATLAREFWLPGSTAYDLGCATGTTLLRLAGQRPSEASLVGYDNSQDMLAMARSRIAAAGLADAVSLRLGDLNGDLNALDLSRATYVTMAWTLQFVRPLRRPAVARWTYENMQPGGALVICEKVLVADLRLNRRFLDFYYELKRLNGYSESEIARKREALENVLVPYRMDENIRLFTEAGFATVEPIFQWFNFAAFLCLKK